MRCESTLWHVSKIVISCSHDKRKSVKVDGFLSLRCDTSHPAQLSIKMLSKCEISSVAQLLIHREQLLNDQLTLHLLTYFDTMASSFKRWVQDSEMQMVFCVIFPNHLPFRNTWIFDKPNSYWTGNNVRICVISLTGWQRRISSWNGKYPETSEGCSTRIIHVQTAMLNAACKYVCSQYLHSKRNIGLDSWTKQNNWLCSALLRWLLTLRLRLHASPCLHGLERDSEQHQFQSTSA